MRDFAFIVAFLAMLPMALRFSHVGTMLWTWIALIAPNNYTYGAARGLPFNKIVVAVAVISLVLDRKRAKFYVDTHVRLLIGFVVIAMISYMFALSDKSRVDILADRVWKEGVLCLFIIASVRSRLQIHSMLVAVAMGLGIHGAIEGAKYLSSGGGHILVGLATIGDNNNFGLAMLMVLPLLVYLYQYSSSMVVRAALVPAVLANIVAVIASNSRGALVGMVAVGFAAFLRSRHKLALLVAFAVFAGAVLTLAPQRYLGRMSTIDNADQDNSFMSRVNSWKINTLIAFSRPLTGGGFSAGEDAAVFAEYVKDISTFDFIPTPRPTIAFAAHSIYFQVLGDIGFIGFAAFLGMIFVGFRNLWLITRLSKGRPDLQWAADLAGTFRLTMVAYTVAGAALSMAYFEMFYIMVTLISVTRRHVAELALDQTPAGLAVLQRERGRATGGLAGGLVGPSGVVSARDGALNTGRV